MADEDDTTETDDTTSTSSDEAGGEKDRHDRHLAKTRQERDAERTRRKELESKLAKYEKDERDKETARARKEQDFSKVEARYKGEIDEKESKIRELEQQLEGRTKADRRRNFAAEIAKVGGVSNVKLLERAMADLPEHGIEVEPEKVSKSDVDAAIKVLKKEAPELFGTASPKPPGRPGLNTKNLNDNEAPGGAAKGTPEYYRQMGAAASQQSRIPSSYASATGRASPKE
jgi:chromosome segregation ATPase